MLQEIKLEADGDVVAAWRAGLALGRRLGLGRFKQACLSSAVLELSRHVVESGGGVCTLSDASDERVARAAVTLRGAGTGLAERAKQRLSADTAIGPAMPAVKLRHVVESCGVAPEAEGATITLAIHEPRRAAASRRPLAPAGRRP